MPQKVNFTGANNPVNEYVYSAVGKKLAVIHKSSTDKRTDYAGNMIYENSSLKRILVDGGYIENGIYHFFLQDHLGNNRIVAKADGTVVQTNHYYPYGMSFAESTLTSNQPYRYNGKEIDWENGLNLYDYEARQMEVATGRFTTIDSLAEKYYTISPYAYCANNPVKFIDPDGRKNVIYNQDGSYKETANNNWFHNTFMGIQYYVDQGRGQKVQLSEQEFWNWQKTGSYASIGETIFAANTEFYLDESPTGFIDGAAKLVASSIYSIFNSPKVLFTGRTISGSSTTSDEKMSSFIDVAGSYFPTNKIAGKPISWYKFKNANKHIPTI